MTREEIEALASKLRTPEHKEAGFIESYIAALLMVDSTARILDREIDRANYFSKLSIWLCLCVAALAMLTIISV